ncbi:hypothetical protein CYY_010483 [Polysphondylium violaceum]|uniref:Uncharacterized protein n=1 Tax=Polysphondylium violaceum TaxID=133409 RepID=A0A8J4UZR1_9MYCE|nr:hypothetical protein CYY_010483 [Polysphondylium violaceum]
MRARQTILKTYCLSKFTYKGYFYQLSDSQIQEIERLCKWFLHASPTSKLSAGRVVATIAKERAVFPFNRGGRPMGSRHQNKVPESMAVQQVPIPSGGYVQTWPRH